LYYGPSLRNVTSGSIAAAFRSPGVFDVTKQARYLSMLISPRSGNAWECSGMSVKSDFNPNGE
jgi:hypothetical protein